MLDFLKQMNQLRAMQDAMKKETVTMERNGAKVTMRGDMRIDEIIINPNVTPADSQRLLKDLINEARGEIEKRLAGQLMSH